MKTIHAPGTLDALLDAAHTWAQGNPAVVFVVLVALTALIAYWID